MGGSAVRVLTAVVATVLTVGILSRTNGAEAATWCIAQSAANETAIQTALDYACGSGEADCLPIQPNGLCYLPNTLAAHASYAFNSYYQRSGAAPGACDFAGTATVSVTDPSYGSCTYPSSSSTAGGSNSTNAPGTNTPTNSPVIGIPPPPGLDGTGGGVGGLTPSFGPPVPNYDTSSAATVSALPPFVLSAYVHVLLWLFW